MLIVVCFFVLTRLKDPGRERTESRTPTATRTSSKTAVRCSVGQHTRGNFFQLLSMSSVAVPVIDYTIFLPLLPLVLVNNEQDAVSDWLPYLAFQHLGQKRTNAGGIVCFCNACCTQQQPSATNHGEHTHTNVDLGHIWGHYIDLHLVPGDLL